MYSVCKHTVRIAVEAGSVFCDAQITDDASSLSSNFPFVPIMSVNWALSDSRLVKLVPN